MLYVININVNKCYNANQQMFVIIIIMFSYTLTPTCFLSHWPIIRERTGV